MNLSFRRLACSVAMAIAAITGVVGLAPSPASASVDPAPGPCVDPLAMPDWCHGIPLHGWQPPALNFTLKQVKPAIP